MALDVDRITASPLHKNAALSQQSRQLRVLLIHHEASRIVGTVDSHIEGLVGFSRHKVVECDASYIQKYKLDLDLFDVIVLHYSLIISSVQYITGDFVSKLSRANATKILFIQDEYRWVDRTAAAARAIGVDCVFTVVNKDVIRKIYHHRYFDDVRFEVTLTGFVPEELTKVHVPDYGSRPVDVAYRARKLPGWLGEFGQQKWVIGDRFQRDAVRYGLRCDISSSENDRIYGQDWISFVAGAKAVLGTESGASFIDFTGEVQPAVEAFEARYPSAPFSEIQEKFLQGRDGEITIHVISPRCFEAAALRTMMIMYPGEYSGALEPYRHYLPLNIDHSNMDEVVSVLRDPERAMPIIERAYREIACSDKWTFNSFVKHFDNVASELAGAALSNAPPRDAMVQLSAPEFKQVIDDWSQWKVSWARKRRRKAAMAIQLKRISDAAIATLRRSLPDAWRDPVIYRLNDYKRRAGTTLLRVIFGRD